MYSLIWKIGSRSVLTVSSFEIVSQSPETDCKDSNPVHDKGKAVILHGSGGFFSSGADLNTVRQIFDEDGGHKMNTLMQVRDRFPIFSKANDRIIHSVFAAQFETTGKTTTDYSRSC